MDKELLKQSAYAAHKAGWAGRIVPLKPGTKVPAFKNYQEKPMELRELVYWNRYAFNIAFLLKGNPHVCVIDQDGPEGADFITKHGLDKTPMIVESSKGPHFYHRVPDSVQEIRTRIKILGLPVDAKMSGHIVAPGSWNAESEHRYSIRSGSHLVAPEALPMLPESFVELLNEERRTMGGMNAESSALPNVLPTQNRRPARGLIRNPEAYVLRIESIQGANGSAGLIRAISVLRDEGRSAREIFQFLTAHWNFPPRVSPKWPEAEIRRAILRHTGG